MSTRAPQGRLRGKAIARVLLAFRANPERDPHSRRRSHLTSKAVCWPGAVVPGPGGLSVRRLRCTLGLSGAPRVELASGRRDQAAADGRLRELPARGFRMAARELRALRLYRTARVDDDRGQGRGASLGVHVAVTNPLRGPLTAAEFEDGSLLKFAERHA